MNAKQLVAFKKAFLKQYPNALPGIWNFWEISHYPHTQIPFVFKGKMYIREYQTGVNADLTIKIGRYE